jgi:methylated-DNA-[protein]-cysteine S-methyltransferase
MVKTHFEFVVTCHRVTGTDGSLTGYVGGLWRKKWLFEHE